MPRPPLSVSTDSVTPFGSRLIAVCRDRGLSLVGLSLKAGWSTGRCSQLIRTEYPTMETVERLARVLMVDRSVLDPDLEPINVEP